MASRKVVRLQAKAGVRQWSAMVFPGRPIGRWFKFYSGLHSASEVAIELLAALDKRGDTASISVEGPPRADVYFESRAKMPFRSFLRCGTDWVPMDRADQGDDAVEAHSTAPVSPLGARQWRVSIPQLRDAPAVDPWFSIMSVRPTLTEIARDLVSGLDSQKKLRHLPSLSLPAHVYLVGPDNTAFVRSYRRVEGQWYELPNRQPGQEEHYGAHATPAAETEATPQASQPRSA